MRTRCAPSSHSASNERVAPNRCHTHPGQCNDLSHDDGARMASTSVGDNLPVSHEPLGALVRCRDGRSPRGRALTIPCTRGGWPGALPDDPEIAS